ncbi:Conserved_hypothetical protein [Hexamita inflata]|uniref:Transmembrane protein n=1 Tax=Hexamita inflata TaxID=28002 RepID=A0AA86RHZ2_9EUKA|nr:Conserved hypothetical protein [Hexamita inflata]
MYFMRLILTQNCFQTPISAVLKSIQQFNRYELFFDLNCSQFIDLEMKITLVFPNINLPSTVGSYIEKYTAEGPQVITFQFDSDTYKIIQLIQQAHFIININNTEHIGYISTIYHTIFDIQQCWNKVKFSVDYDWAFNISLVPLGCSVSKYVKIFIEYFNVTWISIPIIPTDSKQLLNGYQTGGYEYNSVLYFNTSSESDHVNADLIVRFVEYFKTHFDMKLRLKVEEQDQVTIKTIYLVDINELSNQLTEIAQPNTQCIIDTWYSYSLLQNTSQMMSVLKSISNGFKIFAQQLLYDENQSFRIASQFSLELNKFSTRKGIAYYHNQSVVLSDQTKYYYTSFIQLQDIRGKLLASLYFSGLAFVPCFTSLQYLWFKNQVCASFFLNNTPTCVSRYNSSISGQFLGEEANSTYPLDPDLRKTFFYMNYYHKTDMSWFGRYNMICMDENNGSGLFQGENMTYGTFSTRIYDFGKYIQCQETNLSINVRFTTQFELEYVTQFGNHMGLQAFTWAIVILVGILLATGASVYIGVYTLNN